MMPPPHLNEWYFTLPPQAHEPLTSTSHVLTVSGLMPSSTYNCSVTSFSYSTPSRPAHVTVTTVGERLPLF